MDIITSFSIFGSKASACKTYTSSINEYSHEQRKIGSGGIGTHVIEMTGAWDQRLRPLGHATFNRLDTWFVFSKYPRPPLKSVPFAVQQRKKR